MKEGFRCGLRSKFDNYVKYFGPFGVSNLRYSIAFSPMKKAAHVVKMEEFEPVPVNSNASQIITYDDDYIDMYGGCKPDFMVHFYEKLEFGDNESYADFIKNILDHGRSNEPVSKKDFTLGYMGVYAVVPKDHAESVMGEFEVKNRFESEITINVPKYMLNSKNHEGFYARDGPYWPEVEKTHRESFNGEEHVLKKNIKPKGAKGCLE